ncbi:MAG TPA: sugar ABC transporter ATP-binding protein [Candidatus Micrarchaeaceae archaeon]|nr:sugar ABC transporter ATP-binding protein [Candidatus Micrarchaeaceae archaeon]
MTSAQDGIGASTPTKVTVLKASKLAKSYGGHLVLKHVDFSIGAGEIVAVIGENGAGKSTFAKIVTGVVHPDSGEMQIRGRVVDFQSPRDALRVGVAYIPQELAYLSNRTVADNILIGRWPHRAGITSDAAITSLAVDEAKRFGIELHVNWRMAELTLAERQLVEIVKALIRSSQVLVLDEPTASLTSGESRKLFGILRQLVKTGLSVIFISHRMDEVFDVSDRVVVLRNGDVVGDVQTAEASRPQLISLMLGAAAEELGEQRPDRVLTEPALQLVKWSWNGEPPIHDLNLTVNRGEIVTLFGLRGSGGEAIAEGLAGRNSKFGGTVVIEGREFPVFKTITASARAGIGYLPAERKRDGLVMPLSVQANLSLLVLRSLSRFGWLQPRAEHELAERMRNTLQIRLRSLTQPVATLSGGNQQKVVLGSRLLARPRVLVLQEPTRGVDVGARFEIHHYLRGIAEEGTAILWVTTDVEEAVLVADRLVVLREGAIVAELIGKAKTQGQAVAMAAKDAA